MHQRLYDLDLQLADMAQAGVDLSVLSCLLGWSAPLEECRFINDDLAAIQKNYPRRFVGLAQAPILDGTAADLLKTPMRVASTAFRQPEQLPVLFYRSTAGLAKLAST
jgi:predicted TIM-barrel fold metal-dependent hydrolase